MASHRASTVEGMVPRPHHLNPVMGPHSPVITLTPEGRPRSATVMPTQQGLPKHAMDSSWEGVASTMPRSHTTGFGAVPLDALRRGVVSPSFQGVAEPSYFERPQSPLVALATDSFAGSPPPSARPPNQSPRNATGFNASWSSASPLTNHLAPPKPNNNKTISLSVETSSVSSQDEEVSKLTPRSRRKQHRRRGSNNSSFGDEALLTTRQPTDRPQNSSRRGDSPLPPLGMTQFTVYRDQPLGAGASAVVYKGFDNVNGDHVAVKVAHVTGLSVDADAASAMQDIVNEFRALTTLRHENIVAVKHLELDAKAGTAEFVMEWLPSGSISSVIEKTGFRLHEMVIRRYLRDALSGLRYLHSKKVLHRDVKSANLLLGVNGVVKLSDFGTCRFLTGAQAALQTQATKTIVGTPAYMAPEIITQAKQGRGADMWALACSVCEMATGQPPWSHLKKNIRQPVPLMFHIGTAQPPNHHPFVPPHLSPELRDILLHCFEHKSSRRPSAADVLELPYFDNMQMLVDGMESFADYAQAVAQHQALAATIHIGQTNERRSDFSSASVSPSSSSGKSSDV